MKGTIFVICNLNVKNWNDVLCLVANAHVQQILIRAFDFVKIIIIRPIKAQSDFNLFKNDPLSVTRKESQWAQAEITCTQESRARRLLAKTDIG